MSCHRVHQKTMGFMWVIATYIASEICIKLHHKDQGAHQTVREEVVEKFVEKLDCKTKF